MTRRNALVCAIALGPWVLAAACSDPPAKPEPARLGTVTPGSGAGGGGGGTSSEAGTSESGADGGDVVCNMIVENGGTLDRTGVNSDPPTALGGTIVDGTYDLTDYSVYVGIAGVGGPTGITAKATIVIAGGKIDEAIDLAGTGKTVTSQRTTSVYSASGATIAETATCPPGASNKQLQFTVNQLGIVFIDLTSKEAFTFTKR